MVELLEFAREHIAEGTRKDLPHGYLTATLHWTIELIEFMKDWISTWNILGWFEVVVANA
jgi:hypothetical protein